jgi:isopentenyl phosphate kinase
VDGVYDADPVRDPAAQLISSISTANWASIRAHLGGSHGTDVTGGMLSKVEEMIRLARQMPGLEVQLISGEPVDALKTALLRSARVPVGTTIRW